MSFLGSDPWLINTDLRIDLDGERSKRRAEFSDLAMQWPEFEQMQLRVRHDMAARLGIPQSVISGVDTNYASCLVTPNPKLPLCQQPMEIDIIACDFLVISRMRPRPKSRRYSIIRKWLATRHELVPSPDVYCIDGRWYGHPDTIAKMATALQRLNSLIELKVRGDRDHDFSGDYMGMLEPAMTVTDDLQVSIGGRYVPRR